MLFVYQRGDYLGQVGVLVAQCVCCPKAGYLGELIVSADQVGQFGD